MKMTLEQIAEWFWRAKHLNASIPTPSDGPVSAEASATGVRRPSTTWIAESVTLEKSDLEVTLGAANPVHKREDYAGTEPKYPLHTDLVAAPPLFYGQQDFGDGFLLDGYYIFGIQATGTYDDAEVAPGSACRVEIEQSAYFAANLALGVDALKVGENEYWLDPIGAGIWNTDERAEISWRLATFALARGTQEPGIGDPGPPERIKSRAVGWRIYASGFSILDEDPSISTVPVELQLSRVTLSANRFAILNTYETETDDGTADTSVATVSASIVDPPIPVLKIAVEKWWGYGGIYDEATGAKL